MRYNGLKTAICLILGFLAFQARAQYSETRAIQSVYAIETGGTMVYDNYLSPLRYKGANVSLSGNWSKSLPANPQHLLMSFDARLSGDITKNPAVNRSLYNASVMFDWGLLYRWQPRADWMIYAGGTAGFSGGGLYLPNNGNNPADARLSAGISIRGAAQYRFKIKKLQVRVSDAVTLPSVSAFFTHGYGEPYYEIYLGNREGLVAAGWWGNHFGIDNLLAADLKLGKNALRVGYRFNVDSSWINSLNTQITTHSIVIGIIPHY